MLYSIFSSKSVVQYRLTFQKYSAVVSSFPEKILLNDQKFEKSENSDLYCTKCFFFSLKCTKIVGGWGSAPDPAGELTALPQTL